MRKLFIDIESTGLSPFKNRLHGIAAALDDDKPIYYSADSIPDWLLAALADPNVAKVNHNLRAFDLYFLGHALGIKVGGPLYCTLVMSLVADDSLPKHNLKYLSAHYFGAHTLLQKNELDLLLEKLHLEHVGKLCDVDLRKPERPFTALIGRYCVEDVENNRRLFKHLHNLLKQQHVSFPKGAPTPFTYYRDEIAPTESILHSMEMSGVRIDKNFLEELRTETIRERDTLTAQLAEVVKEEVAAIEAWLLEKACKKVGVKGQASRRANPHKYKECVFNFNSGTHFGKLVYEALGVPFDLVKRTKSRAYSTKEDHLKVLLSAVPQESKLAAVLTLYAALKKTSKIIGTYTGDSDRGIASLLQTINGESWLFPQYKQTPATGRLACFPIQQLPRGVKKIKRFFIPSTPDRCFIYSDLSAIEFRNAAHLSQDPVMLKMIRDNIDPHIALAARIFNIPESEVTKEQRNVGKTTNYLMLYGGSEGRLVQELALKNGLKFSKAQGKQFLDATFSLYSGYKRYLDQLKNEMETTSKIVGINGRIRHVKDIVYGRYLQHDEKKFTGPRDLRDSLLETPDERVTESDLYYRANGRYRHALNSGYNHPNQSLGGTMMKAALKRLSSEGLLIRASIHDAVIVECDRSEAKEVATKVKAAMEGCYPLSVPIKSDTKILNSFDESDIFDPDSKKRTE